MVTISTVCKSWRELMMSKDTWFALYTSIGLRSMAPVFYIPDGTAYQNSKRFFSYGNWAHGIFTYREFQAHPLGILCMWFDGKYLATGSSDRTCRVFQIKNSQCIRSFEGHEEAVQAIQFDDEKVIFD
jgi:WD40 repeat protein